MVSQSAFSPAASRFNSALEDRSSTGRAKQSCRHLIGGKREQVATQASFGVTNPTTRMLFTRMERVTGSRSRAREPEEDRNQLRHLHSIGVHGQALSERLMSNMRRFHACAQALCLRPRRGLSRVHAAS
jgi:hypothetical protein